MSSDASTKEAEGLADIFTSIRDLARQLFADPAKIDKIIQTLKIWGLWPVAGAPKMALAIADDDRLKRIIADVATKSGMPMAGDPEKIGDGRLLEVLRAVAQWAQDHPEIISALVMLLKL